jgi:mannose-6-phosphate isomerase-like protein (cupin superfamily)
MNTSIRSCVISIYRSRESMTFLPSAIPLIIMALDRNPRVSPVVITEADLSARQPETFLVGGRPNKSIVTWHTLFSSPSTSTTSLTSGIGLCPPRTGVLSPHRHKHAEVYHIIEGSGVVTIDGKESKVEKGTSIFIPGDAEHGIRNDGEENLRWFYCFAANSFEDIIYRWA